jgi:hypothetical protein
MLAKDKRETIIAALEANPNASQVARQIGHVRHETVRLIARADGIALAGSRPRKAADGRQMRSCDRFRFPDGGCRIFCFVFKDSRNLSVELRAATRPGTAAIPGTASVFFVSRLIGRIW